MKTKNIKKIRYSSILPILIICLLYTSDAADEDDNNHHIIYPMAIIAKTGNKKTSITTTKYIPILHLTIITINLNVITIIIMMIPIIILILPSPRIYCWPSP